MLSIIKVQGESMMPELADGDFVVISRLFWSLKPRDKVVAYHEIYDVLVKQIHSHRTDKGFLLEGLNSASVSSEKMGWISPDQMIGKVLFCIKRKVNK
jgi:signal peptidase I